jgi:heme-degrading monooxygenase HmoA
MIARFWHGRTYSHRAQEYQRHLFERDVPKIRMLAGNVDVQVLQRTVGNITEFIVLSWWENLDAIRAFTGDNVDLPQYSPEDKDYLIEFETHVQHFEVAAVSQPRL